MKISTLSMLLLLIAASACSAKARYVGTWRDDNTTIQIHDDGSLIDQNSGLSVPGTWHDIGNGQAQLTISVMGMPISSIMTIEGSELVLKNADGSVAGRLHRTG